MTTKPATIMWTLTDEAPLLATYSLLPMVRGFLKGSGVAVETPDISLAGRIIANFPEKLTPLQRIPDYLTQLGDLTQSPPLSFPLPSPPLPLMRGSGCPPPEIF